MSLAAFAVRVATVRAIRAAVWPEFIVADSPQRPLDLLEQGGALIAVYTGTTNEHFEGNELLSGSPVVQLTIQIFLPPEFTVALAGRDIVFDTREEGADTLSDAVARRILAAFPTQAEPWSELWGRFVIRTQRATNGSYLVESDAVRVAARELVLDLETLYDPVPGAAPEGTWADLVALMSKETEGARPLAPIADWLVAEIAGPALLPQEERDRIDLGLASYAAQAVGILPIVRGSEIGEVAVTVTGADGDQVVVQGPAAPPAD